MMIALAVSIQYTSLTDRETDTGRQLVARFA